MEILPVFKALRWANPEKNVGPIHKSNPEHFLYKAARGDNSEVHLEYLLVFKAPSRDNPQVQPGNIFFVGEGFRHFFWGVWSKIVRFNNLRQPKK